MSSPTRNRESLSPGPAWLLTGLGLFVVPAGLFLADRVQASWWTKGLWISAAGSACLLWGVVWLAERKAQLPLETARGIAAALALALVTGAFVHAAGRHPRRSVDLVRILLDTHRFVAGLVLVSLASDSIQTASERKRRRPWFWIGAVVLAALGLFATGWDLQSLAAWRFPVLAALGALPFFLDYLLRRRPLAGR